MNPATLEVIVQLIGLAENAYSQVRDLIAREKAGQPLSDTEIASMKSTSDAAHAVIQAWKPKT